MKSNGNMKETFIDVKAAGSGINVNEGAPAATADATMTHTEDESDTDDLDDSSFHSISDEEGFSAHSGDELLTAHTRHFHHGHGHDDHDHGHHHMSEEKYMSSHRRSGHRSQTLCHRFCCCSTDSKSSWAFASVVFVQTVYVMSLLYWHAVGSSIVVLSESLHATGDVLVYAICLYVNIKYTSGNPKESVHSNRLTIVGGLISGIFLVSARAQPAVWFL